MKNTDIEALVEEAYRLLDSSERKTAIEKAKQILIEAPNATQAFLLLAEAEEDEDRYDYALDWVNKGLTHHPDDDGLLLKKASLLIDGFEEIDEAFAILSDFERRFGGISIEELKREHDEDILLDVHLLLADCYRLKGDFHQALRQAHIATAIVPSDENAILALAQAQFELGNFGEALDLLDPVSSRRQASDFCWLKAQIKCAQGLFAESDQAFFEATRLAPDRYHQPLRLSQSDFFECFEDAVTALPEEIADFVHKTSVQIKNVVPLEMIKKSLGKISPQACIATEKNEKGLLIIFLFQKNIENLSSTQLELIEAIASALLHELMALKGNI